MAILSGKAVKLKNPIEILGFSATVGPKEAEGPLAQYFDIKSEDEFFSEDSFEKAESRLQQLTVKELLKKTELSPGEVDLIFAGDLLNQCIGSAYGLRDFGIPFVGLYGSCSTMALGLIMALTSISAGTAKRAIAVTSSHFCSSERQFRFPLEYGGQRPPTAQWTVTGSGAVLVGSHTTGDIANGAAHTDKNNGNGAESNNNANNRQINSPNSNRNNYPNNNPNNNPSVADDGGNRDSATLTKDVGANRTITAKAFKIGKIVDLNVTDMNNMGAAMAPDSDKIRPYPNNVGMVFFYTQIQYLRGLRADLVMSFPSEIYQKTV